MKKLDYVRWLEILVAHDDLIMLQTPKQLWKRIFSLVKKNFRAGTDTIGFTIVRNRFGEYRLVENTTSLPVTDWHTSYEKALKELQSCL